MYRQSREIAKIASASSLESYAKKSASSGAAVESLSEDQLSSFQEAARDNFVHGAILDLFTDGRILFSADPTVAYDELIASINAVKNVVIRDLQKTPVATSDADRYHDLRKRRYQLHKELIARDKALAALQDKLV